MKDKLNKVITENISKVKEVVKKPTGTKSTYNVSWGDSLLGRFLFYLSQKFNNRDQWGGRI